MGFARKTATDQRLLTRSCESLIGICRGLLADQELNDSEINYLTAWLADNDALSVTWPGEVIVARIRDVLADGHISDDERQHLKDTLSRLIGGTLEETGTTDGVSTRLPVDVVESIKIVDSSFCFTGNFMYGTRLKCESPNHCRRIECRKRRTLSLRLHAPFSHLALLGLTPRQQRWVRAARGTQTRKLPYRASRGADSVFRSI